MNELAFLLLGLFSGFLGGLLGIGGGVIAVPGLFYLFSFFGYSEEHLMQMAVSTSLAATCLTALGSSFVHWRRKAIIPSILRLLAVGLVVGCILGTILAYIIPTTTLRTLFGVLCLLVGPYFLFPHLPSLKIASAPNRSLSFISMTIGMISCLLGIGGGMFTVPILHGYHVPLKNAIGTSSVATLMTAFLGSVSFLMIGWLTDSGGTIAEAQVGFIDLKACGYVGLSSLCSAMIGARFSLIWPIGLIKKIFGCALIATGAVMLFVS